HEDLKTSYSHADDNIIGTMMKVADSNNNGYVEYDEFEKVLLKSDDSNVNGVMEDVFKAMDCDGDGKVGYGDLRSYLNMAGLDVHDDELKAMIRLGGGDYDGVTFDGFMKILSL
nr:calcium-binding EF-hand [Tanacetum cinerariifolium]